MKLTVLSLLGLFLCASTSFAGTIQVLDVQLGTWDGANFTTDGNEWNTNTLGNWALGITNPVLGASLLNTAMTNDLGLADGEYYLYMGDSGDVQAAMQLTVSYEDGSSNVAVFTSPSGNVIGGPAGPLNLVSGSGIDASLLLASQSTDELVGGLGQGPQYYAGDGTPNWALDFNSTPEPGTWTLLAAGIGGLFAVRRYRRRQAA